MKYLYQQVKAMHEKFGLDYTGPARYLDLEESNFRAICLQEELDEYKDAKTLEDKLDALVDLTVFALGTAERHGFDLFNEAFSRVMTANCRKEVAECSDASKRGFAKDLIKPPGWRAPYLGDLVNNLCVTKGLVVLEGPDHTGKSTLGEFLVDGYGAHYIHSTWSKNLSEHMGDYLVNTVKDAIEISKRQLVVLDRTFISDVVYDLVYRKNLKDAEDFIPHATCASLLNDANALYVFTIPRDQNTWQKQYSARVREGKEMYGNDSSMLRIYDTYNAIACMHQCQTGSTANFNMPKYMMRIMSYLDNVTSVDYLRNSPRELAEHVFDQLAVINAEGANDE